MTDRNNDEIIATGPRDWTEAQRVNMLLAQNVRWAMTATNLDELSVYAREAKQLLDMLPMVATLRAAEVCRLERSPEPFHMKLSECSESVKRVMDGTIPKHDD